MVGGFVQNQKVDFFVHQHTQPQAGLLATGEIAHTFEYILTLEQKGAQTVTCHLWSAVFFIEHGVV